jgi:proteasome lid subunit RPN8/RPN11
MMTVHRLTPLPTAANRGRLIVGAQVLSATKAALQQFRGPDGRHEGLVYWVGRRCEQDALAVSAVLPVSNHGLQHVFIAEVEVGRMSRRARAMGLAVVAQVHSHPGTDTRHSDGDDKLILMPFEGLFSLVVARYGDGSVVPGEGAGLHQYQDRRWVLIAPTTQDALVVVPPLISTTP